MQSKFLLPAFLVSLCLFANIDSSYGRDDGHDIPRDTLSITIKQAEDLFIKNNLSLIAGKYNIDNAKAQVITARLFDNPQIGFENGLYNPDSKKFLDISKDGGQQSANISQLFQTAGKRNKNIQLAKLGVQQAEYQFFDLLRTLKYTLRTDFYKIYFQEQSAKVYAKEINSLSKTLIGFQQQYAKENIALKEVLRIQSQLYTLQSELNDLKDGIDDVQSEFKLLIRTDAKKYIVPQLEFNLDGKDALQQVTYKNLLDSAYNNRYDLKVAHSAIEYSNVNLRLQKAMVVPDITMSVTYDKQGSYIKHYTGLGISIPLPLFNRNQGNIRQAKIAIDENKLALTQQEEQIQSDLDNSYQSADRLEKLYNSFDPKFKTDFNHLIEEVFRNYQKHNISLLEFLDFYDSYKTNTIQLNNLQLNRISSLEQLNYITGTQFFNQ
ncbi:cobalt-zinc-cadmium efflux system outer membrane protein [Pedobacter cryoconitis]|uniref:TolC family protein n=1 Tax=Pedobacter cryoconitis TaxID=188932 RepID=UPI0016134FBC|nr:TolC family protein [Pedobacter cryoconitis]MBB6270204.1 cobalt-zinc-cadmium efflux system outer membrane protein [Pedobacter cryoconitis]